MNIVELGQLVKHEKPGYVPEQFPVEMCGEHLRRIIDWQRELMLQQVSGINQSEIDIAPVTWGMDQSGPRLHYNHRLPHFIEDSLKAVRETGVYGQVGVNGYRTNVRLQEEPELFHAGTEALRRKGAKVVLPFVDKEEPTVEGIADYAAQTVGSDHVLAVHAGQDSILENRLREIVPTVNQASILRCVDWNGLKEAGILPGYFEIQDGIPLPGRSVHTKGLTMLAGGLVVAAQGGLESANPVGFHDTDIVNPWEYAALQYWGQALAFPVTSNPASINVFRTGEGRNNEPWLNETNRRLLEAGTALRYQALLQSPNTTEAEKKAILRQYEASLDDEQIEILLRIGYELGSLAWPLTGERLMAGDKLMDMPFSTGMGIETQCNVYMAGLGVESGRREVMQVADPNPKTENGESYRDREFNLIFQCASWQKKLVDHIITTGRLPHHWTIEDIALFNKMHSGIYVPQSVPNRHDHLANVTSLSITEYVLPSIRQLAKNGFVNLDSIANYTRQQDGHHVAY